MQGKERFIDIVINEDGTVDLEGINFEGADCEALIDQFARTLGPTVSSDKKPEYYNGRQGVLERGMEKE